MKHLSIAIACITALFATSAKAENLGEVDLGGFLSSYTLQVQAFDDPAVNYPEAKATGLLSNLESIFPHSTTHI